VITVLQVAADLWSTATPTARVRPFSISFKVSVFVLMRRRPQVDTAGFVVAAAVAEQIVGEPSLLPIFVDDKAPRCPLLEILARFVPVQDDHGARALSLLRRRRSCLREGQGRGRGR
jgi:hypothetical protein